MDFSLKYAGEKINELLDKAGTALQEHQDISGKQDVIEDLDTIRENSSKVADILGEDGYVYSNGEKVDMRFTRSLLPVGTSIPAKANLNTKTYLKIGKYYCSLNADAKTITNCPVNVAFSMEVFNPLGTNVDDEDTKGYTYRLRVLTQYDTGQQYMQFCRTNGTPGTWTYDSWYITPRVKFTLASSKNDGSAAVGSATQGVYVDSTGALIKMTYTLAKSVPSSAVFTDTKVTAVENHYAPAEDEESQIDAPEGELVIGLKMDAAGHVVGVISSPDISDRVVALENTMEALVGENSSAAIESFNEIIAFLEGVEDSENLDSIIASIEHQIAGVANVVDTVQGFADNLSEDIGSLENGKQDKIADLDAIKSGAALGATALQSVPEGYATEQYVTDAIASAITNALKTPV